MSAGRPGVMFGLIAAVSVLLLSAVWAAPAHAHAIVRQTEPATGETVMSAPSQVVMRFNEPVEIAFGAIRVFDASGRRVDRDDAAHAPGEPDVVSVTLQPDIPDGTYTVSWRVVSADSHPVREAFVFHVGEPGSAPQGLLEELAAGSGGAGVAESILLSAARWFGFVGLLMLIGAVVFATRVWRPPSDHPGVAAAFLNRWRAVGVAAWVVLVVATLTSYVGQAAVAADLRLLDAIDMGVFRELAGTRFGRFAGLRLLLLAITAGVWVTVRRRGDREVPLGPPARWALLGLAIGLAATPGLAGHAGTTPPVVLNLGTDVVHILAAAAWAGGLLLLLLAAFPATRALAAGDRTAVLAPVVARFSDTAVLAVGLLVATGLLRAWAEVRALHALTGTGYGVALLVKLGAFVPLLALGAVNNRWAKPRLLSAATGDDGTRLLLRLRRLVASEVALVAIVLAVTAFLVNLPPARVTAGVTGPFATHVALGDGHLNVVVEPNRVGENAVHLIAGSPTGEPIDADAVEVRFTMPERDLGPLVATGTRLAPGHWTLQGHELSVPGEWTIEVIVPVDRFTDARASFAVTVNP